MKPETHNISATISSIMQVTYLKTDEFCKVIKINKKEFCEMRNGKIPWSLDVLKVIAVTFRISLDRLILGSKLNKNLTRGLGHSFGLGKKYYWMGFEITSDSLQWLSFKTGIPKVTIKKLLPCRGYEHKNVYKKRYKQYIALQKIREAINSKSPFF